MLLSDVVKVIGSEPLSEFPWGCIVIQTMNLFVVDEYKLTPESTSKEVHKALDSLDEVAKELVLGANLDAQHCRISAPVGGGMTLEFEDESAPSQPDLLTQMWINPLSLSSMAVVTVIVIASVVMLSTLSIHQDVEWSALAIQFFKLLAQSLL